VPPRQAKAPPLAPLAAGARSTTSSPRSTTAPAARAADLRPAQPENRHRLRRLRLGEAPVPSKTDRHRRWPAEAECRSPGAWARLPTGRESTCARSPARLRRPRWPWAHRHAQSTSGRLARGRPGRETARIGEVLTGCHRPGSRPSGLPPCRAGAQRETVYGGHEHALRQTVLALTAGSSLDEHQSPGEATVQVLRGRVRLTGGKLAWEGRAGDLLVVPDARHALQAVQDAVVLLTVSKAAPARHP
jgi:quercetin dioxygenase-like cupin family protein